jgi:hypothetical protein
MHEPQVLGLGYLIACRRFRPGLSSISMTRLLVILLPVFCVALTSVDADSPPDQDSCPHPRGYVCYRAPSAIAIDGKAEDAWNAAPWSAAFIDIEGDKQPAPAHKTRMKMLWDDEALYILAELDEPDVWATLTRHDSVIFHDNDFEVFLDPDGDNHNYGELEINALNTTWDLLLTKPYKDGGRAVNAWEITGLKTAVKVDGTLNKPGDKDRGWTVEIRWPFAGLQELMSAKLPPRDGDQWRINFSRVEWDTEVAGGKYQKVKGRAEHNWVWSPQGLIDMHRPERWGYLQFSTANPGQATFRTDPDWPIRDLLHRVYYAERAYFKANGKYSKTVEPLNLKGLAAALADPVSIETTASGFELSVSRPAGKDGRRRRFSIMNDGLFKVE